MLCQHILTFQIVCVKVGSSPLGCLTYVDDLNHELVNSVVFSNIGDMFINNRTYADNMVLLGHSVKRLRKHLTVNPVQLLMT